MPDLELARQLVDYVDATTTPVGAPTADEGNPVMLEAERSESPRSRWMLVAASAAVVATVAVVAFVAARNDATTQADDDGSTGLVDSSDTTGIGSTVDQDDDALPSIESAERERQAVTTVTEFFAAYGRGDVDAVLALLDPVTTDELKHSELVRWWSAIAATGDSVAEWPTAPCTALSSGEVDPVVVECPVSIDDPVAVELGLDDLTWTADAFDNGVVRPRIEPRTADRNVLAPVWRAYADYLSEFRADEYAADCDPSADSRVAALDRIALTRACAELVESVGEDVVRLRWAEGFWQAIIDGDREAAAAFGDSSIISSGLSWQSGWASTLEGQFDWWAAVDFEWTLDACRPLPDLEVECDVTGRNAWSQAMGVEPVPGTFVQRFGVDGITAVQDQSFVRLWGSSVYQVFRNWVDDNHPDDADVMWEQTGTVAEALELFEINTQRFVAARQDG